MPLHCHQQLLLLSQCPAAAAACPSAAAASAAFVAASAGSAVGWLDRQHGGQHEQPVHKGRGEQQVVFS
jgi:hypothetical protein